MTAARTASSQTDMAFDTAPGAAASAPPAAAGPRPAAHAGGRAGRAPRVRPRPLDDELRSLYRDLGARAPMGRRGHRAAAPGRAGHLGLAARPGRRPSRCRPRAAARRHGLPDLPRARGGVDPGRGPLHVIGLFRGVDNGGWDPVAIGFNLYTIVIGAQCLHATGYAMGVQREATATRTPSWPSSATARPARARSTRR